MDIIANNLSAVLYHDSRGHMIQATSSCHQFYLHNISIIIFFLPLLVNSGDSKLLEEAVIPLAKTLSMFTIMPFVCVCVCLWAFSLTGISVELHQWISGSLRFKYCCFNVRLSNYKVPVAHVIQLISSLLLFSFPSWKQSQIGELWRSCENFPGKNQRVENLHRMPRVSMGTSEERMNSDDCVGNDRSCAEQLLFDRRQGIPVL